MNASNSIHIEYLDHFEPYKAPENPYLEVPLFLNSDPSKYVDSFKERNKCICQYSFAIPDIGALELISKYSPIIEIGAGSGYWSYLLTKLGIDIVAFDNFSWRSFTGEEYFTKFWFNVEEGSIEELDNYPNRTLFLSWPDYKSSFAFEALKRYKSKYFIYIGEAEGGCCGDDLFFEYLNENFDEEIVYPIYRWFGIHDRLYIYSRK